jgi:hypothetical protein
LLELAVTGSLCAQDLSRLEDLAGRWEAPDGQGGQIGMNILLSTTVSNSATDVIETAQQLAGFEIAVYQRSGSDVQPFGFNFFATSPSGGATWDGRYLRIGLEKKGVDPRVHVDLEWDQTSQTWSGTFERGAFRSQAIALKRPAGHKNSRFIGTWFERNGLMNNCLHIAEAQDGTFTGWGDDIQIPDRMRYAYGLRPPDHVTEHYGEIAKVKVTEPDRIEVELRAYTPTCCSHSFTATISHDGNSLVGEWLAGGNQAPRAASWRRVQADSCLAELHSGK